MNLRCPACTCWLGLPKTPTFRVFISERPMKCAFGWTSTLPSWSFGRGRSSLSSNDGSLNKATAKYIEHKLYQVAKMAHRAILGQNRPQDVQLSESDKTDAERFLAEMLNIFPLVGLTAFQPAPSQISEKQSLVLDGKGISAKGFESDQGFVVLADSYASTDEADALLSQVLQLRKQLQEQGVLVPDGGHLRLTTNYVFNSPTSAAQVFLATPISGRTAWKDKDGKTLKMLQELASGKKLTSVVTHK